MRVEKTKALISFAITAKLADQLCDYREADLRLCFHLCRLLAFPRGGSYISLYYFKLTSLL